MLIPSPYNRSKLVNTNSFHGDKDYISYEDYDRQNTARNIALGGLGVAALGIGYVHRTPLALGFLKTSQYVINSIVGKAGVSAVDSSRLSSAFNLETRMVREMTRTIRYLHRTEYISRAAERLASNTALDEAFGITKLQEAFGLGKTIGGKVVPGGNQFAYYKALSKSFIRPDETKSAYSIYYDRFKKLTEHSNVNPLINERKDFHIAQGLSEVDAIAEAKHEFAHNMAQVHSSMHTPEHMESLRKKELQLTSQVINDFTHKVVNPLIEEQKSSPVGKLLKLAGIESQKVEDHKFYLHNLENELSKFVGTSADGEVSVDTSRLFDKLGKLHDYNKLKVNGETFDLTMGRVAVSKVYNQLREGLQIPVAPFQKGFSLFSFFPHLRGQSNQFIHTLDSRTPLPFISDLTGKAEMDDPSRLGTFVVFGKKTGITSYKGQGSFIGNSITGKADEELQTFANSNLKDIALDVRDAKSGYLREINTRGTNQFLKNFYPEEQQSLLDRIFTPGGRENSDTLLSKYRGVFEKFIDPKYLPNVWKDKVLSGPASTEPLDHLSRALRYNSGYIAPTETLSSLQKLPEFQELINNTTLNQDLKKLLRTGFEKDSDLLEYFASQARDFDNILKNPIESYSNSSLRNLVSGFRTSLESALGYGRNNDPFTIADELGLNYLKGTLGDNSKSQGLDYLREQLLAEFDLKTAGKVRNLVSSSGVKNKSSVQAYLLGHELNSVLEGGNLKEAVEMFRPLSDDLYADIAPKQNRQVVERFLKRSYPLTGTNWKTSSQEAIEEAYRKAKSPEELKELLHSLPGEGSEYVRGRYLITKAPSTPITPLDVILNFNQSKAQFREALSKEYKTVSNLFSSVKRWFTEPENRKDAVKDFRDNYRESSVGRGLDYWNNGVSSGSNFRLYGADPYFITSRLNKFLTPFGLSLGKDDMTSPGKVINGLFLKRILPAFGIVRGLDYLDYKANERKDDYSPDNLNATLVANTNIISARLSDKLGFTQFKKKIASLLPGAQEYLNFDPKTEEEYKEYLTSGRDPVRKSRGWLFGSRTPYAGTSINYYEPNSYLRSKSNYESSPGGRKSKESFFSETGDLYAYEKANSIGMFAPRPYVYSAPLIDPNITGGVFINNILGKIFKPQKQLNDPRPYLAYNNNPIPDSGYGIPSSLDIPEGEGVIGSKKYPYFGENVLRINSSGNFTPKNTSEQDLYDYVDKDVNDEYSNQEYNKLISDVYSDKKSIQNVRVPKLFNNSSQGRVPENPDTLKTQSQFLLHQGQAVGGIYGFFTTLLLPDKKPYTVYADSSQATGYESRFYDAERGATFLGLPGGLVDDQNLNEVIRRIITRKQSHKKFFNPLPNEFAGSDFLPGAEEYVDLQSGDAKAIKNGLARLPGEAYRKLYKPRLLTVDVHQAVQGQEILTQSLIRPDIYKQPNIGSIYAKLSHLLGPDIETAFVYDDKDLNLRATADVVLGDKTQGIVRNLDTEEFNKIREARQQDTDYLSVLNKLSNTDKGIVVYIDPETNKKKVIYTKYNENSFKRVLNTIQHSRQEVINLINNRVISEADIYDPITKFDIASDVAPYSAKTKALGTVISHTSGITKEDWEKFQAIKKRTSKQKKQTELFQYKFLGIHNRVQHLRGTIETIGDDGAIYLYGEDRPIKLAGGRISTVKAREYLAKHHLYVPHDESEISFLLKHFGIRPGKSMNFTVDSDSPFEFRKDLLKTRRGIVENINKKLIDEEIIDPKDTDQSPTTILLTHSKKDIQLGAAFEYLAHADNPINSKFLRVRSPLEAYKRQIVYGTVEGSWQDAYSTYIAPTVSALASKNPITATAVGALVGSFFGSTKPAKLFGAKVGGVIGLTASLLRMFAEGNGEAWMPPSVKRRREIEEYFDILKYIKERKLYEKKADEALTEEHTDVREMVRQAHSKALHNEEKVKQLLDEKRKLYKFRRVGKTKQRIAEINAEIKTLSADQGIVHIGPKATEALLHQQSYRSTLYGAKPDTALMDIMSAMPRHERAILMEALKSPDKDKTQLYRLLSKPQQRVLGLFLGQKKEDLPDRPLLSAYFENHQLPGEDSDVWNEDVNIEDLKTRALAREMPRKIELGIFPQSVIEAENRTSHVEVPYSEGKTTDVKNKLNKILSRSSVNSYSGAQHNSKNYDEIHISTNIKQDRKQDYDDYINRRM